MSVEEIARLAEQMGGKKNRDRNAGGEQLILQPPSMPMLVARQFLSSSCMFEAIPTLRYWRGGWWLWRTSSWQEIEERALRSLLYKFTEHAIYDPAKPKPWAPNRKRIGDLVEALSAVCILPPN